MATRRPVILFRLAHLDHVRYGRADAAHHRAIHVLDQRRRHLVPARADSAQDVEQLGLLAAIQLHRGDITVIAVFLIADVGLATAIAHADAVDSDALPDTLIAEVEIFQLQT